VCPTLGYKEFLHADWLVQILSWQKPVGCWGAVTNIAKSADDAEEEDKETGQQQQQQQQRIAVNTNDQSQQGVDMGLKPPVFRSRHLLYEKAISGNQ